MAGEAVGPMGGGKEPMRRWGVDCYAGEWVRATEPDDEGRARWIDDDDAAGPSRSAPRTAAERGRTDA